MASQLSDVTITVIDGALGIAPPNPSQAQVKIGVCSNGTPNVLYSFADPQVMQTTLGQGPLVEAAAHLLAVAGGSVYCMPVNPSQFGYAGSVTQLGTGTGTVAVSLAPPTSILIKITTAGTIPTMAFTYQIGSGPVSAPVQTTGVAPFVWVVPGLPLTTVTFAAGTYVLNSTYTIGTDGSITIGGGGINAVTQQSSPLDAYQAIVTIAVAGGLGVGAFKFSVDNGNTQSAQIAIPGGGGKYAIPNTGLVLTFAGTFVAGDTYSFNAIGAGFNNSDVTNALTALITTYASTTWRVGHLVGTPSSAANAAATAATVDTQMTAAANAFIYGRFLVECPTVGTVIVSGTAAIIDSADTDTVVAAAFTSFTSTRVGVCAGDCDLVSSITGRIVRRNAAWAIAARLALVPPGEDGARVGRGSLPGVRKLYRDEGATPALDVARFNTLRSYQGIAGFYPSGTAAGPGIKTMALVTSDYYRFANGRVMDVACSTARAASLKYVQASVRVNKTTGTIFEQDAQAIEKDITSAEKPVLTEKAPPDATAVNVQVDRTNNILASSTLNVSVRVTPLGYIGTLNETIGMFNPALAAA